LAAVVVLPAPLTPRSMMTCGFEREVAALVAELDGDLSAVVGLPLDPVLAALAEHADD
jgi:predicted house-cleaning NTP pyrophosphatase (Maf/HAM1 superfamily)